VTGAEGASVAITVFLPVSEKDKVVQNARIETKVNYFM
jgi:hypothetical protein